MSKLGAAAEGAEATADGLDGVADSVDGPGTVEPGAGAGDAGTVEPAAGAGDAGAAGGCPAAVGCGGDDVGDVAGCLSFALGASAGGTLPSPGDAGFVSVAVDDGVGPAVPGAPAV
jgi:hypothetical protein